MQIMTTRDILAANLRKMVDKEAEGSVRAWAMARKLDVRLIDRMTKGEHAVTLDKIELVASACGIPSWQLLLPDFEPGKKIEAPITDADRELLARLKHLLT